MSLGLSDEELAKTSLEYIQYPELRANQLLAVADIQAVANANLEADQGNKKWTDFYRDLIQKYSTELNYLYVAGKTLPPSEASMDLGAQRLEPYFPADPDVEIWVNLPPKIQASNNGNPTIAYTGISDPGYVDAVKLQIDGIINGISGSGASSQLETAYSGGGVVRVDDVTGFVPGDIIFVFNSGDSLFAEITSIVQDPGTCSNPAFNGDETGCLNDDPMNTWTPVLSGDLNVDVISPPTGTLPVGSSVTTTIPGFSNAEREESVGLTPERNAQLQTFKNLLDEAVQTLEDFYDNNYLPLLNSIDDKKNSATKDANISDINATKAVIDNWQAAPSTNPTGVGVESRFGDIELGVLDAEMDARKTYITQRIGEINTLLGSVSQDAKGDFTGDGLFYDFADWEKKRIATGTGSRSKYYAALTGLELNERILGDLDSSKDEQDVYYRIEALSVDADGTNFIQVADASGFANTDTIKIFAEGQSAITTTIVNIVGTTIEVGTSVSSDYSIENVARILKEK